MSWVRFLGWFMVGWILGLMLIVLTGCDLPTEYQVNTPDCPWPPPLVTDTTVTLLPLGCPYRLPNGQTVDGWPRL